MEITSFGLASKAASDLKRIRKDMGNNVTSSYANVKERLDQVEKDIEAAYKLTDEIIVNNAINIAKAEAKINTIANATKFDFEQMIFDDLFDSSGIDTTLSKDYSHDSTNGTIKASSNQCEIITNQIDINNASNLIIVSSTTPIKNTVDISFDKINWHTVEIEKLIYIDKLNTTNKLYVKFSLPANYVLNYYSVIWS